MHKNAHKPKNAPEMNNCNNKILANKNISNEIYVLFCLMLKILQKQTHKVAKKKHSILHCIVNYARCYKSKVSNCFKNNDAYLHTSKSSIQVN